MIKEFMKLKGIVSEAPYVDCIIGECHFIARLDSGADISIVPRECVAEKILLNPITIRIGDGEIKHVWTIKVKISITELGTFTPEKGVLLTDDSKGLIGMDILNQCYIAMEGGVFILELR